MKHFNCENTSYKNELDWINNEGESVGYQIGNSDNFLVFTFPVFNISPRKHSIYVGNWTSYIQYRDLTFNLG
jgi:hypothetical protein